MTTGRILVDKPRRDPICCQATLENTNCVVNGPRWARSGPHPLDRATQNGTVCLPIEASGAPGARGSIERQEPSRQGLPTSVGWVLEEADMWRGIVWLLLGLLLVPGTVMSQGLPWSPYGQSTYGPITITGRIGWLDHRNGLSYTFDQPEDNEIWQEKTPLRGVWMELSCHRAMTEQIGFTLTAGGIVPVHVNGLQRELVSAEINPLTMTSLSWGIVEGLFSYGVAGNLELLGGFRWDYFNSRFALEIGGGEEDLLVNSYLPLIGVQINQKFYLGSLLVRVFGCPFVPGHMKWNYHSSSVFIGTSSHPLNRGHFIEGLGEYTARVGDIALAGVFVRWNNLRAVTSGGSYDWRFAGATGTNAQTLTQDRYAWTVGGTVSIDYNLPTLWGW